MKSNNCKKECIDRGHHFCASKDLTVGMCCYPSVNCDRYAICSDANKDAPKMFKYLSCPNEAECGDKNIFPQKGTTITRMVDKYGANGFVSNDVCSYIVHSPADMGPNDKMKIHISKIQ